MATATSYEGLARRWRPTTFDDVVGQRHVTVALRNAIRTGRVPHAILLAGPRGVGKTTIARILARALNCDRGPTDTPCGECGPCREIAAGTSLDVQEIDAASHTGVDHVRELRESIRYAAAPGKHRIFIVDEVHMLSQAAFNALLKTLEEPPPRSLFVFATTDPQRIPATVLSRVQRFDLRRLGMGAIVERLRDVARAEGIAVPERVLYAVAREADGSLRDALVLLDRLVGALGSEIDEADAMALLDLVDARLVRGILEGIVARDPEAALRATRSALDGGVEPVRLAGEILEGLRHLVVLRLVPGGGELVARAPEEVAELETLAGKAELETLQRLFRVALARAQDLPLAPRPDFSLEMAVVRLATLPEAETLAQLVARLDALLEGGGPGGGGGGARPARATPRRAEGGGPSTPRGGERGAPPRRRDPDRLARLRAEAKRHPAVQELIRMLDAEIEDIRIDLDRAPEPEGDGEP